MHSKCLVNCLLAWNSILTYVSNCLVQSNFTWQNSTVVQLVLNSLTEEGLGGRRRWRRRRFRPVVWLDEGGGRSIRSKWLSEVLGGRSTSRQRWWTMMGPPDEDDEVAIDNCNESSKDPSSTLFFYLRQSSSMWPPRHHWWTPVRPVFPPHALTPLLPSTPSPYPISLPWPSLSVVHNESHGVSIAVYKIEG